MTIKESVRDCILVKKYGLPHQVDGKCEGFAISDDNDEPCDECKECELNTAYGEWEDSPEVSEDMEVNPNYRIDWED